MHDRLLRRMVFVEGGQGHDNKDPAVEWSGSCRLHRFRDTHQFTFFSFLPSVRPFVCHIHTLHSLIYTTHQQQQLSGTTSGTQANIHRKIVCLYHVLNLPPQKFKCFSLGFQWPLCSFDKIANLLSLLGQPELKFAWDYGKFRYVPVSLDVMFGIYRIFRVCRNACVFGSKKIRQQSNPGRWSVGGKKTRKG